MRVRWSLILPASGLILFGSLSYHSLRWNHEFRHGHTNRYFWWSSVRLDSDPLNKHPKLQTMTMCKDGTEDCFSWDPESIWIDPGWMTKLLVLSALPAFVVGKGIVHGLARWGIS